MQTELTDEEFEVARLIAVRYVEEEPNLDTFDEMLAWYLEKASGSEAIADAAMQMVTMAMMANALGLNYDEFMQIFGEEA